MAISPCNTTTDLHRRELVQHGSTAFPIACYADELAVKDVPWHWHEEFEFAMVTEGEPLFLLENARFTLRAGEGIFINGGALHGVENAPDEAGMLRSAVFHPRLVGGSMDSVFWQRLVQPLAGDAALRYVVLKPETAWQRAVLEAFDAAWAAVAGDAEDGENETRYHLGVALRLITQHCVAQGQMPSAQAQVDAGRIRAMLTYIEDHYAEEISTEQIAASVAVSPSVCLRCFHQTLGTTPIQYVKHLRLDRAAAMLRSTALSAREIASACGFADASYFTKAFREKTGMTPAAYRKAKENTARTGGVCG